MEAKQLTNDEETAIVRVWEENLLTVAEDMKEKEDILKQWEKSPEAGKSFKCCHSQRLRRQLEVKPIEQIEQLTPATYESEADFQNAIAKCVWPGDWAIISEMLK